MPNWRFLVVRQIGRLPQRRQTCLQIKRQVAQQRLSNVLPLVKYELGRQGEYYLGLAVDVDASVNGNDAEEVARHLLLEAGVRAAENPVLSPLVEPEQVKGLLRGTLECESFTVPLVYERGGDEEAGNVDRLLAELDVSELSPAKPDLVESEQYARLLQWCSATGSGEIGRIRQTCQALGINQELGGAWSVLRRLILLGHLEFDGGRSYRWSIIPPTLVTSVEDHTRKILVGQRTPNLVEHLRGRLNLEEQIQPNGPPCLRALSHGDETYYRPGRPLQDVGCVSRELSERLPTFDDWISRLPNWDERDFGRFNTEKYDPQTDRFHASEIVGEPRAGLYRFTLEQSEQRLTTIAYFDDSAHRWLCGDYYGLRFLARKRRGLCRVIYHRDRHELVVPSEDRWPMPYERAVVLANGTLPQRLKTKSEQLVLVYEGLTAEFAARMCNLLELKMEGD